jgi:Ca2+-transporting ATPase
MTSVMTSTTDRGLTSAEASQRLAAVGPNALESKGGPKASAILLDQVKGVMTWLLVGAAAVSFALSEIADGIAILIIVVINVAIGFFQEYRAERAVEKLRAMTAPHARVLRDGHVVDVAAIDIVPDDILALEAGDLVAADARLIEVNALTLNEGTLTGESLPVEKRISADGDDALPLAERRGHVFMGTAVSGGTGRARVMKTGMTTELGKIAALLESTTDVATPLKASLEKVGRMLLLLSVAIVIVIAALGAWQGRGLVEVLMNAVSLAVAAVPEGLTAIVTIALALGVQRMASRHVLVRRLPAVETLGSTTVICTDKTGTLTTGVMGVREVWGLDEKRALLVAASCCDADLTAGTGDAMELAILQEAFERGISASDIERDNPRTRTNPFDAVRKRMSIRRRDGVLYVKGALDLLAPLCTNETSGALAAQSEMASRGLRVLGIATGTTDDEAGLTLTGLVGLADPPRTEAIEAVKAARRAGITTVMITGDHPVTAEAIAREMCIIAPGETAEGRVHARATPEDKIAIVRAWKAKGAIVAMTGDGVNDAPALKEAHIGIAMGITGTEVTREASDMILTDDNFASIVAAVREGRGIFDNIRKALLYLLAGNTGEIFLMLGASLLALPLPLTPLQILWVNLVTDGLPALALVTDPIDDDALNRPPRPPDEPMLGRPQWLRIIVIGLIEAACVSLVYLITLDKQGVEEARNLAFLTLVCAEVMRSFAARSHDRVLFEVGLFSNMRLVGVVALTLAAQLALHYVPALATYFDVGPIHFAHDAWIFAIALVPVTLIELSKLVRRVIQPIAEKS